MNPDPSRPLGETEIAQLDELLASVPETADPLDVAMLDGFLAGVLLHPEPIAPAVWMPLVFDAQGRPASLPSADAQRRAEALIMRRHDELAACIAAVEPFDPIVFELVDDNDEVLDGKAGIGALAPWAGGFANALAAFGSLQDAAEDDDELAGLLTGILRHLPVDPEVSAEEQEEHAREQAQIEQESPLADLDEAIDDMVDCVLAIAPITRPNRPVVREAPKIGRNDACPCGSGKKYKACHGRDS